MGLSRWESLPKFLKNSTVEEYYKILRKKRKSIIAKRIVDLCITIPLVIILSIVMVGIALCIKIDSRGPIFFVQERVTQYGRKYYIFKFRTMIVDAEKEGPSITQENDNRVTRIGRLLRKYKLDELPQVFNVLTGDMTLVGTRPEVVKYVEQYTPEMRATLLLPAGVTSRTSIIYKNEELIMEKYLAETNKTVDEVYMEYILPEKMKYNLEYIEELGVREDIRIMIKTILAVIK